jgi:hypothetical protein
MHEEELDLLGPGEGLVSCKGSPARMPLRDATRGRCDVGPAPGRDQGGVMTRYVIVNRDSNWSLSC